jgi:arylsulfatase
MGDRTSLTVYPGMTHMTENAFINVKNRSHSITAEVEIPQGGAEGVILSQGGRFAGWSLYMKDGRVSYVHNWVGKERYTITSPEQIAPGKATIRYEFAIEGNRPGAGGTGTIFVNGEKVVDGQIGNTTPFLFSADETADVGTDGATPVTEDYAEGDNAFTGKIEKVTVDLT